MTNAINVDDKVWDYLDKGSKYSPFSDVYKFHHANNKYCYLVYDDIGPSINVMVKLENPDGSISQRTVGCIYKDSGFKLDHVNPFKTETILENVRKGLAMSENAILAKIAERKAEESK